VMMGFTTTYGVVRRYFFSSPEYHSYEVACILLLLSCVLALAYTQRLGRNLRVDFFVGRFPEKIQDILLNIVAPILGLVFCSIFSWMTWQSASYSLQVGETSIGAWAIPLSPIKIMVPIGLGLLCLVLIAQLCRGLSSLKGK
jgi:TRAP-type C4-dicarboxylate transport system permease small subunit